jgi:hypothetical protein
MGATKGNTFEAHGMNSHFKSWELCNVINFWDKIIIGKPCANQKENL